MSIETIPEQYGKPFNPLGTVDHERVALYTRGRLMSERGALAEMQRVYNVNLRLNQDLIDRLMSYGSYLEPCDDDLNIIDDTHGRLRAFCSGTAMALAATANLAYELDVNQLEWRERWADLPKGLDAPLSISINQDTTPDDCFRVGAAIMEIGSTNVRGLETPYRTLIEDIDEACARDGLLSNTVSASFGYVYGTGRRIVEDMACERAIEEVVAEEIPDVHLDLAGGSHVLDQKYEEFLAQEKD